MTSPIIHVKNVSKIFQIPHEIGNSVFGHFEGLITRKKYQRLTVLDDISFNVDKGDFVGIIGRNGSGKTTLAKILSRIINPSQGSVRINGKISPIFALGIGFNGELTGKENIYLNATLLGLSNKEIKEKYQQIVDFADIPDFIDVKMKTYSSGMQMRLAFSVVIHTLKDILIVDEALGGVGDYNFSQKSSQVLNDLVSGGKTIVLVSHGLEMVKKQCNKCLYLKNGKIDYFGEPKIAVEKYLQDCKTG